MPKIDNSMWGCLSTRWLAADMIVFAIFWHSLELLDLILFVPILIMHFPGFSGIPPCSILQTTFCALSPPTPLLRQSGSLACERGRRAGRDNRSIDESPIRKFCGVESSPNTQCFSNFEPQDIFGFDKL